MGRAVRRFSLHPSFILWSSLLFYLRPELVLPFLGAALLHELGHCAALCLMGRPPENVTLTFFGARMETSFLSYRQTLLAAAAGPLLSLLLGLSLPVFPMLGAYSLFLGLFNLLPIAGLDGGKILKSLLLLYLPPELAEPVSAVTSIVLSALLCLAAVLLAAKLQLGLWPVVLGAVFLIKSLDSRH